MLPMSRKEEKRIANDIATLAYFTEPSHYSGGLNVEKILNIVKSKGEFNVSRYSFRDSNLRRKLKAMKVKGLLTGGHNHSGVLIYYPA